MDKLLMLYCNLKKRYQNDCKQSKRALSCSNHTERSPWHLRYGPYHQWGESSFVYDETQLGCARSRGSTSKILQKTLEKCEKHNILCRLLVGLTSKKCSGEQTRSTDSNVMLISLRHNTVIETSYNSFGSKYKQGGPLPPARSTDERVRVGERNTQDSTRAILSCAQEQLFPKRRPRQQSRPGARQQSGQIRESRMLELIENIQCPDRPVARQCPNRPGARQCPNRPGAKQCLDRPGAKQCLDRPGSRQCPDSPRARHCAGRPGARQCPDKPGARQCPNRPGARQLTKRVHTTILLQKRRPRNKLMYFLGSTMLQQILRDMYVDPELLAELDEEQKQILFCKMREEQVRQWKAKETALETQERNKPPKVKKPGGKCVDFMSGCDGKPWVWVMGEHKADKSVEEIIEAEQESRASKMAEEEAELLRKKIEEELRLKMQKEEEKLREETRRKEEWQRKNDQEEVRLKIEEEMKLEDDRKEKEERERKTLEEEKEKEEVKQRQVEAEEEVFSSSSAGDNAQADRELGKEQRNMEEEMLKKLHQLKVRTECRRRSSLRQIESLKEQRKSQLCTSFREARSIIERLAEEDGQHLQAEWEQQEKKARVKEAEVRAIARRARHEHSVCADRMKTESQCIDPALDLTVDPATTTALSTTLHSIPTDASSEKQKEWPARPANRDAVVAWFQECERPRGVGINPITQQPLPWFHGIILRREAEELLVNRPVGSFLVRVSERVRGYAISYRATDRCKHYLIDMLDGHYQFFGANQVIHNSLAELVCFHKKVHITKLGEELLLYPCGQSTDPHDYADLFAGQVESSQL